MPTEARFRALELLYHQGPSNQHLNSKLSVSLGEAVVTIAVRPDMLHGGGVVHGAVCFKALDDAATFAICSLEENQLYLTASFNIHYLRPVSSGMIVARGRIINKARRLVVAEAEAVDENGRKLAYGSGTFMPV
jgi:uncharacterized protein (TIGR00369 family)